MSTHQATSTQYRLGRRSQQNLEGVHPVMVRLVERAIEITGCDFSVIQGVRSAKEQRRRVKLRKSQTENSRHIPRVPADQPELGEVSHAVDLAAWIGKASWNLDLLIKVANAMRQAALEENVALEWGGCWDRLSEYVDARHAYEVYLVRKKHLNEEPFVDAGHFQLSWEAYPCL